MANQIIAGGMLGKYLILEELGRGGMGVVYLGIDPSLKRNVALKVLLEDLSADSDYVRRFEEEACAVADLFHPNILPVNALSWQDERLVIEMPYMECGSLARLMDRQGLYCPEVVNFCMDTLEALAACHARGIIHRDVKPSNILLDGRGRALLSDFGLAKVGAYYPGVVADSTSTSMFVGTPRYAPLEAWDGVEASPAWDLYSVGVILFEGLSGQRLVEADTIRGHLHALERETVPRLNEIREQISPEITELTAALLAPSPKHRPPGAAAALEALKAAPECDKSRRAMEITQTQRRRKPIRTGGHSTKVTKGPLIGLGIAALLSLAMMAGLIFSVLTDKQSDIAETTSRVESQQAVPPEEMTRIGAMLSLTRAVAPVQNRTYLATTPMSGAEDDGWAVFSAEEGSDVMEGMLFDTLGVSVLRVTALEEDVLEVVGHSGRFMDARALQSVDAEVRGVGRRLHDYSVLSLTLTHTAPKHGLRWEQHLILTSSEETDTALLWRFESEDYLMPLLMGELLPRNAAWLETLRTWLPAIREAAIGLSNEQGRDYFVDGRAEELFWNHGDRIESFPRGSAGALTAVMVEDGLLFRLTAPAPPENLRVMLQTEYAAPQKASRRFFASHASGKWVEGFIYAQGQKAQWTPEWTVAESPADGEWAAELFIPFASVAGDIIHEAGVPWRVNISLYAEHQDAGDPTLFWGAPDITETEHGVLLWFEEST